MLKRRSFVKSSALGILSFLLPQNKFSLNKKIPNVLILGDSISIGYYPFVKKALLGKVNLFRPTLKNGHFENCAGSTNGVVKISEWLGETQWDLIHFNFGLHDIKHVHPVTGKNSKSFNDPHQASPKEYKKNLTFIVKKLKKTKAKLIFATTTPYPNSGLRPARKPGMHNVYNSVALKVMKKHKISINDLHAYVLPRMEQLQKPQNVHFTEEGSESLAEVVASSIKNHLKIN
jgi:lysophospholipase L1-like esterase